LDQTHGIGDGVILTKYDLSSYFGTATDFSVGLGSKIPLGSSTEKNDQGITLNADLQPGSNAWDLIYWTSFSRRFNFRPTLTMNARVVYRSTGTNSSYFGDTTYKFGNEFLSFLSFSDQFVVFKKLISPSFSFKYRNAIQDEIGGFDLENTGGNWISMIPNISININTNTIFSAKAELPLYSQVDGTQLTPTYRITTGVVFIIPPKKQVFNLN